MPVAGNPNREAYIVTVDLSKLHECSKLEPSIKSQIVDFYYLVIHRGFLAV
jgi:hypothetical protein